MAARTLVVAMIALATAGVASSQSLGDTFTGHPLTDIPPPADGITSAVWFPKHTGVQFEAGEVVEVIAAIRNAGKGQVNVTHVMGSLNDAENFAAHYQNFSLATPQTEIAPGAEAAVVYHFRPDPILPERDFQVALTAFYTLADGTRGAATFFNKTIAIVEPQRAVDWQLLQLLLTMGALVAAAGYAAYAWALGAGVIKKAKKARVAPAAAPTAADSAEWLKGTFYGGKAKKAA